MMKKCFIRFTVAFMVACMVCPVLARAASDSLPSIEKPGAGKGLKALQEASAAEKFLFIFFHEASATQTTELQSRFENLMASNEASATWVAVNRKDTAEQEIVARFKVQRAFMPLVLAVAPNGAVTSGFPGKMVSATAIQKAFVSKGLQDCLAPLQKGKLVLLCLQNKKTTDNAAAMAGVREFAADLQFKTYTAVVIVNPTDLAEKSFLDQLGLTSQETKAQTIVLAPPAIMLSQFKGAVTKDAIAAALKAATSGGCGTGGCASSGCGN